MGRVVLQLVSHPSQLVGLVRDGGHITDWRPQLCCVCWVYLTGSWEKEQDGILDIRIDLKLLTVQL